MSRLLEPPAGRTVFRRAFEPEPADIDANGHVNNVVYLDWAQQLAIAHWESRAPANAVATWAWIAIRHEVDYRRALVLGETADERQAGKGEWVVALARRAAGILDATG